MVRSKAYRQTASALKGMPQAYLVCRDLKHAWDYDVFFYKTKYASKKEQTRRFAVFARRELKCLRCEARRVETFAVRKYEIEKVSNRYDYPEGYLLHDVADLKDIIGMVRLEQVHRALGEVG